MSCAVIVMIGVAVSISVCGISEPVTVTASSLLALLASGAWYWSLLCRAPSDGADCA